MFKTSVVNSAFVVVLFLTFSCRQISNNDKIPVAKVGEKILYQNDLDEIIPDNINKADSTILADDYVNKWIKQELLILKADENLSAEQKNVTKQLQEYRNSLIIYKYKNELLKQKMDTVVTKSQIEDYYNNHKNTFNLNKNIVKAIFVKIPNEVSNQSLIKKLVQNNSSEGLNELREYCLQYAKKFDISIDNWVDFEIVKKNIPAEINNEKQFLTSKRLFELNDSNYYYLVSIRDYKLKNDLAPLEYVKNNIASLILNQRKIDFLKNIDENIYKEGIRQNKFEIYSEKQ